MTYMEKYQLWLEQVPESSPVHGELLALSGQDKELRACFGENLTFGTAGLRGIMGAGTDRMNVYTVRRAALAYGQYIKASTLPDTCVIAYDTRNNGLLFSQTCAAALAECGIQVYLFSKPTPTPVLSFAVRHLHTGGGVVMTASHNPAPYNGMKCYGSDGCQQTDDPAAEVYARMQRLPMISEAETDFDVLVAQGKVKLIWNEVYDAYYEAVLGETLCRDLIPASGLKVLYTPLHGTGLTPVTTLFDRLGVDYDVVTAQATPDGNFPNGIPNPLLPECRDDTRNAVIKHGADMGIAFDGDFDRCFLFDEKGQFIEGYYIVGLLAEAFLEKNPGAKIIHDPRLSWNTVDVVTAAGGTPVMSKTGHAFIKERMRKEDAIYGGEMSAHHYFRDFAYCDSGMIPWLLVAELVCLKDKTLGELVRDRMAAFPASGEINSKLAQPVEAINRVEQHFSREALAVDRTDGISMTFADWRFNLRTSNTEPVVRLNVESRGDVPLMEARTRTLLTLLNE